MYSGLPRIRAGAAKSGHRRVLVDLVDRGKEGGVAESHAQAIDTQSVKALINPPVETQGIDAAKKWSEESGAWSPMRSACCSR